MKKVAIIIVLLLWCVSVYAETDRKSDAPASISGGRDGEWVEQFNAELHNMLSGSHVQEYSLKLAYEILEDVDYPEHAQEAARMFFEAASELDRELRTNARVSLVKVKVRQHCVLKMKKKVNPNLFKETITVKLSKDDKENKVKPDHIKKEKDKKDKDKDKEDKDKDK
ncbi:MAG: hypothetical protein JW881_17390 [Spirochaetales bacterium]|nr:hypothetical protein [Spirochaetales bacterium]